MCHRKAPGHLDCWNKHNCVAENGYFAWQLTQWTVLQFLLFSLAIAISCRMEEVSFYQRWQPLFLSVGAGHARPSRLFCSDRHCSMWKIPQPKSSLWKSAFTHGRNIICVCRAKTQACRSHTLVWFGLLSFSSCLFPSLTSLTDSPNGCLVEMEEKVWQTCAAWITLFNQYR